MTKPRRTPDARAAEVVAAVGALPALVQAALDALADHGADDPRTHAAWAAVEAEGATVHRRSRFLAGKGKGG